MNTISTRFLLQLFALAFYASTSSAFHPRIIQTRQSQRQPLEGFNHAYLGSGQQNSQKEFGLSIRKENTALSFSPDTLHLAETLAPDIGIFTSTALYFAPAEQVIAAVRKEDIGDLNPFPLAMMSLVSTSWLAYGIFTQDPYVVLSNIAGCVGSIGYLVYLLPLLKDEEQLQKTENVLMAGMGAILGIWTILGMSGASVDFTSSVLGIVAAGLTVILCGSPLTTIKEVITTQDSKSILEIMTIAQVVNTALWTMYGSVAHDSFVCIPNGIGLGFGLIQLALKILYPSKESDMLSSVGVPGPAISKKTIEFGGVGRKLQDITLSTN